ncbi:unnamed protein product [Polarella glacialis]|uniref:F-box domain-containing protein n=1 Tax=Polarella glacialis TaxID=89957 RepID=A0A813JSR1_POLGL|nr:unnamed protein product [Polarella glacialis]
MRRCSKDTAPPEKKQPRSPPESVRSHAGWRWFTAMIDFTSSGFAAVTADLTKRAGTLARDSQMADPPGVPIDAGHHRPKPKSHFLRLSSSSSHSLLSAAFVLVVVTLTIGLQLTLFEYLLSGTFAIPISFGGSLVRMLTAVLWFIRLLFFEPLRKFYRWLRGLCDVCHWHTARPHVATMPDLPAAVLLQVTEFLPIDSLCVVGATSSSMREITDNQCWYELLLQEVEHRCLEGPWQQHVRQLTSKARLKDVDASPEEAEETRKDEIVERKETRKGWWDSEVKLIDPACLTRELRCFLCTEAQKPGPHSLHERSVLTDGLKGAPTTSNIR